MSIADPFLLAANILDPEIDPYYWDPVAWARDRIDWGTDGGGLTEYQVEILEALAERLRVCVRGPHTMGKSATDAIAVLWYADTRHRAGKDWKIVTTASAWRQLEQYLWPEIHKWAAKIRWDDGERPWNSRELLDQHLKLITGEAFPVASTDPGKIEGAHADCIFYLLDEAKLIPAATFDAIEGALAGGNTDTTETLALANSTPGPPIGRFYDIQSQKPGFEDWWPIHVTVDRVVAAGRMDPAWVEQRRKQWGEKSSTFQTRVLGNFAADEEDAIIPLSHVEAAVERWHWLQSKGKIDDAIFRNAAADIARTGTDATIVGLRYKPYKSCHIVRPLIEFPKQDTAQTTDDLEAYLHDAGSWIVVDSIGIGAGVADRLRQRGLGVVAFNASERTQFLDRSGQVGFVNKRAAAWWNLREMLEPDSADPIALPPDDLLLGDLCAPRYRRVSGGRIQVESKDEIRKRLGRSTDRGDTVVQLFWPERPAVLDYARTGERRRKPVTAGLLKEQF